MSTKNSLKYEWDKATGQQVHLYHDAFGGRRPKLSEKQQVEIVRMVHKCGKTAGCR
jgi:hypothetical protein